MAEDTHTSSKDAAMAAILKADLSRSRQDELPLSRKSKKGPTFAPTKPNGTDHIPKQQKVALQSAWGNPIKDEESEQVEGLDLKDCPWRPQKGVRKIRALLQNNPPPTQMQPRRPSEMRNNTCMPILVHRPTLAPSPSSSANDKIPVRQMAQLSIQDTTETRQQASPVASNAGSQASAPRPGTVGIELPKPVSKPPSLERCDIHTCELKFIDSRCIPYRGEIMVYPWPDRSSPFIASFHVEMCLRDPQRGGAYALLHLAAEGLPPRIHNIINLDNAKPESDNRFCILKGQEDGVRFAYRIELKTREKTGLFVESIWGVKLLIESSTAGSQQSTTPCTPLGESDVPTTLAVNEVDALKAGEEGQLVDIAPEPPIDTSVILSAITTEAVTAICEITTHMNVDSDLQDILKGIYGDWEQRLRLSRSPGLQETLKDLIHTLFRLDVFVAQALASGSPMTSPIPESIKDLLKPIKYSASELLRMKTRAGECPDALKGAKFIPPRSPDHGTPKALTGFRHVSTPVGTGSYESSSNVRATPPLLGDNTLSNSSVSSGPAVSSGAFSAGPSPLTSTPSANPKGSLMQNDNAYQAVQPPQNSYAANGGSSMQQAILEQMSQRNQSTNHQPDKRSGLFAYSDVPESSTLSATSQVISNPNNSRVVADKSRKKATKGLSSSMFAN